MNRNIELVQKSLDTISPEWQTVMIAVVDENGFEYDIFNKVEESDFKENLAVLLALVAKKSMVELQKIEWLDN
jgi:hypothetical protein